MKYEIGDVLITCRNVGIFVEEMNGVFIDACIDYPEGEAFEIVDITSNENYVIEFHLDYNNYVNNKIVTYTFDEKTIESFIIPEVIE